MARKKSSAKEIKEQEIYNLLISKGNKYKDGNTILCGIFIGNMFYVAFNNRPCYAYLRDMDKKPIPFNPIWDKEQTEEFGWANFNDVEKIFNLISDNLK